MAGRPRAFDEAEVLGKAMALFWRNGYGGTGVADLERETGLGRQSLYGAFGDKRALFERVVEHYEHTVLRPGLLEVLEAPGSPRKNLERLFEVWEQWVSSPEFNGCLVGNCVAEMCTREPELAEVLGPKLLLIETWLRRTVERAQRAREVPAHIDAQAVARAILALSQGLSLVARVHREKSFARSIVASAARLLDGA